LTFSTKNKCCIDINQFSLKNQDFSGGTN